MAGCYGGSFEDRHFENVLMRHLAEEEGEFKLECEICEKVSINVDCDGDDDTNLKCPHCNGKMKEIVYPSYEDYLENEEK